MNLLQLTSTLHARASALFLLLIIAVGACYYVWMERTVFALPNQDPAEEHWYDELANAEIDSLAALSAGAEGDAVRLQALASEYGARIADYAAEIVFFDAVTGAPVASSDPDSLNRAAGVLDIALLADMTDGEWNFDEVYPDPSNIDAYVNRIYYAAAVPGSDGRPTAYLAGSWKPLIFAEDDINLDARKLWLQAILVGLAGSLLMGWVVLAWLTRRIRKLSAATAALTNGQLSSRVKFKSGDDIGRLGRDFNTMASHLETLIEELRKKELFQRQLIANISHDLRTPMSSLRGYIETLSIRGAGMEPGEYRRYLDIITSNLAHLDRLVDHLLQLSRLDAGQTRVDREDFPLPELIESVLARCLGPAQERSTKLEYTCPRDLPMVHADPLQIGQVLQNLVENGIKFGHDNGLVRLVVKSVGDDLVDVAVHDDGPGIPLPEQPRIFERCYSCDPARTRKGQSSGLGLAIAAKIIKAHDSRLTVESEPGRGACFRFQLQAAARQSSVDED